MNTFIIVNIIFGLLGLFIAYKIKTNKALKKQGKQMVCLVGHKCDDVVFSDYSTFLGLNLEIMGFVYYAAIALFYIIYLLIPSAITEKAVLKNISQFGWFVLFLFILNNVGLYLPARFLNEISQNPVTLLEVVFIILIVINAIINQTQVLPEIHTKSLKPSTMPVARISKLRKIATAQSVISLFLWYGLFYINFMM
jgi:uncharacterized membrane protein